MSRAALALALGAAILAAVLAGAWRAARWRPRRLPEVPPASRPGPSDEELDNRIILRWRALGFLTTLFMALFLPAYFLLEPVRMRSEARRLEAQAVERGKLLYGPTGFNCAQCHGPNAEGGLVPGGFQGKQWAAPDLTTVYQRYSKNRLVPDVWEFVRLTIEMGRPRTPMPALGVRFGGPLNDQQIADIIAWLKTIQRQVPLVTSTDARAVFSANCAVCHGPDARGGQIGPDLTRVSSRLSRDQVRETITLGRPGTDMPPWGTRLSPETIEALVAYIESIQRE